MVGLVSLGFALSFSDGQGPDGRRAWIDQHTLRVETSAGERSLELDPLRPLAAWSPEGRWVCAAGPWEKPLVLEPGRRTLGCVSAKGETRTWETTENAEIWVLVATDRGECGLGLADGRVVVGGAEGEVVGFRTRGWPRPGVLAVAVGQAEVLATDVNRTTWTFYR